MNTEQTFASKAIQLINQERAEQIHKHGFSIEEDSVSYEKQELVQAAIYCLNVTGMLETPGTWPKNWYAEGIEKIDEKPYKERLIVAAALLAAQVDKVLFDKEKELLREATIEEQKRYESDMAREKYLAKTPPSIRKFAAFLCATYGCSIDFLNNVLYFGFYAKWSDKRAALDSISLSKLIKEHGLPEQLPLKCESNTWISWRIQWAKVSYAKKPDQPSERSGPSVDEFNKQNKGKRVTIDFGPPRDSTGWLKIVDNGYPFSLLKKSGIDMLTFREESPALFAHRMAQTQSAVKPIGENLIKKMKKPPVISVTEFETSQADINKQLEEYAKKKSKFDAVKNHLIGYANDIGFKLRLSIRGTEPAIVLGIKLYTLDSSYVTPRLVHSSLQARLAHWISADNIVLKTQPIPQSKSVRLIITL